MKIPSIPTPIYPQLSLFSLSQIRVAVQLYLYVVQQDFSFRVCPTSLTPS